MSSLVLSSYQVGGGQRSIYDFIDAHEPVKRWVPLVRYSGKGRGHIGLTVQYIPDDYVAPPEPEPVVRAHILQPYPTLSHHATERDTSEHVTFYLIWGVSLFPSCWYTACCLSRTL